MSSKDPVYALIEAAKSLNVAYWMATDWPRVQQEILMLKTKAESIVSEWAQRGAPLVEADRK